MTNPLADRIRPESLEQVVGQQHLLGPGKALRQLIESGDIPNLIFYGPPGVGKTTVASIIAKRTDRALRRLNGTNASTADIRALVAELDTLSAPNGILLYLDEIQYFNKRQQQSLLEYIENGKITLISSTTENPYFSINNAVISRVRNIYEFRRLSADNLVAIIRRALEDKERGFGNLNIKYETEAVRILAEMANGDARVALDTIGFIVDNLSDGQIIDSRIVSEAMQRKVGFYDKEDDRYNLLSALQKSVRGSDPDAAVHYLARLLDGGADIRMIGRRLLVMASEDIGMAYPSAISIVTACVQAADMVGLPEAAINLAQAVVLLASAPKSNASCMALEAAMHDIKTRKIDDVPPYLKDSHYKGANDLGYGQGYKYPHAFGGYVEQQYLPDNLYREGVKYYKPTENGSEAAFKKYLESLQKYGKK